MFYVFGWGDLVEFCNDILEELQHIHIIYLLPNCIGYDRKHGQ